MSSFSGETEGAGQTATNSSTYQSTGEATVSSGSGTLTTQQRHAQNQRELADDAEEFTAAGAELGTAVSHDADQGVVAIEQAVVDAGPEVVKAAEAARDGAKKILAAGEAAGRAGESDVSARPLHVTFQLPLKISPVPADVEVFGQLSLRETSDFPDELLREPRLLYPLHIFGLQ